MRRLGAGGIAAIASVLATVALASTASAQDRVIATLRIDGWDRADLSSLPGPSARVLLRGTLTCAIDGAEIDALEVATSSRIDEGASPLVLPPGARLVERRGLHEYLFEVPTGPGATIALNVPGLAAERLVTASELRESLSGVILADVVAGGGAMGGGAGVAVADAGVARSPIVSPFAPGGAGAVTLSVPLLALGLFVGARRRADREAALMARVARAKQAIEREAKVLGPAFDGALASADALVDAARRQRAHVDELDRAIARSRWVRGGAAGAALHTLRARRAEASSRLEAIVEQLEETVVRMAACVADRSAIAGLERDLARARSEVELGESVEQEIARIGA